MGRVQELRRLLRSIALLALFLGGAARVEALDGDDRKTPIYDVAGASSGDRSVATTSFGGQLFAARPGAAYYPAPNYVGAMSDSAVVGMSGSLTTPSGNPGAAGLFEKFSTSSSFNALAGLAYKTSSAPRSRATGVYGEAADTAGGFQSFVEGGRFQGTLISGADGAAYGVICAAGNDPRTGVANTLLLIGCEGEVDDQIGPDAPTFGQFSRDRFRASFLATQGVGSGKRFKADGAFIVNPYSLAQFQTGLLLTSAVADTGIAATRGTRIVKGIDLSLADIAIATLVAPNNAPIQFSNVARTRAFDVLNVDPSDNLEIGAGISRHATITPALSIAKGYEQLSGTTFETLPPCIRPAAGTIAYIVDAAEPISTWHQPVTAGGGANRAFIACNGSGWFAFDY